MNENSPAPITLDEQIEYCEVEAARWTRTIGNRRFQPSVEPEAQVRHDYYCAIAASLRYLQEKHDLFTTQEIEPVTVTACPGFPGVEALNDN
jgi:hypothetical protein